jgi:GTP-binding protein
MGNIVAIVGRPNVGKSTLYNRLIGARQSIVDDISGVTRDRQYGTSEWNGKVFNIVDTGGFVLNSSDVFEKAIRSQVKIAMDEASVIIFMVDVTTGITDLDEEVARMLRRTDKHVLLAVNKVDNGTRHMAANEFWSLGFKDTFFLSSISGSGTGDVLDMVTDLIEDTPESDEEVAKIAVLGQPNAGKSSLVNALLGEERNIVTDVAGTTRDAIHTKYEKFGKEFYLIDTAGLRKKTKVHENLEFYSVMRAIKALEEADVCLVMIDGTVGVEQQDLSILRLAQRRHKGIVILINKWDLVNKETNTARDLEKEIRYKIAPFTDVDILFVSALEKQRIFKAVELALEVYENRTKRIGTSILNNWLEETIENYKPPMFRGKMISIKYMTQTRTHYPGFAFFCNYPQHITEAYQNYLENKLRDAFKFTGVPMKLFFRKK